MNIVHIKCLRHLLCNVTTSVVKKNGNNCTPLTVLFDLPFNDGTTRLSLSPVDIDSKLFPLCRVDDCLSIDKRSGREIIRFTRGT